MSLFRPERRDANLSALIDSVGARSRTRSKIIVTDESALRHSAVWSCVDLLSDLVSTTPLDEYRKGPSGERIALAPSRLLVDPAGDDTGVEVWLKQLMVSELLRGNNYGFVLQVGGDGWPTQIESLHPDRVTWKRERNMGPVVSLLDGEPVERWPRGPLWHLPAYVFPGSPIGLSPIRYAAETIGVGLAAQRFGAQWFGDGAHPTSVYESDQPVDETQATVIKERIKAAVNSESREPLVLGAGGKLNSVQVSPEESQFLETIKANADQVASFFFRRPPGEGGQVTYANVEARSLDLLTYTLNGWLVRVERALTRLIPRPRYVKFNADALVRVDLNTRVKTHGDAIRSGWRSVNDVRGIEDLPPIPDGDEYLWPPYRAFPLDEDGATQQQPPGGRP